MSTIQAQLVEYAKAKLTSRLPAGTLAYARPWTFVYREPTGECVGVRIDVDGQTQATFSVAQMLSDVDGHARACQMLKPGPRPSVEQREAYRAKLPGVEA